MFKCFVVVLSLIHSAITISNKRKLHWLYNILCRWNLRPEYFMFLKALSYWRRRRRDYRDWSVAATRATRETKYSLRFHQSGDVAATAPCLHTSPRSTTRSIIRWCQHTLSHVITKVGQTASSSVAEKSLQRLLSLQQVSETSRRRRGDVSSVAGKISLCN